MILAPGTYRTVRTGNRMEFRSLDDDHVIMWIEVPPNMTSIELERFLAHLRSIAVDGKGAPS